MIVKTIGFIGAGRVTRILLAGWQKAHALPANIVVSDPNPDVLANLKRQFPSITTTTDNTQPATRDLVFLAVHPPVMADVVAGIKTAVRPDALVVSLAPKFTMTKLAGMLGGHDRIARVIPNAPSYIGKGYNPVTFDASLTEADKAVVTGLFLSLGECLVVAEEKLEAYAILSAMGPTYFWFQLQALREVAMTCGLTDAEIAPALKRMICGTAQTLFDSGLTADGVMDLIPVRPLGEDEAVIKNLYLTKLPALHAKIKP